MGPGKADLLDAIEASGSISAAARSMGMSYRRAWLLVDAMNRCFAKPLVETHPGGGQQAGAKVTELGRDIREAYRKVVEMAENGAQGEALDMLTRALKA
ncbi:LysR family transcriptional regulator [Erythrobacter sp. SG61-1L]|uniref:winged helix-turn-helix domain-containing protein n=1 Tax=Erythrobacter sp. SG61-1L TaxID=1603897 RepID=UPI0006C8EF8E|nr:LysR family transcriptional regulator [Erythrobacter sp. SG61-1L]